MYRVIEPECLLLHTTSSFSTLSFKNGLQDSHTGMDSVLSEWEEVARARSSVQRRCVGAAVGWPSGVFCFWHISRQRLSAGNSALGRSVMMDSIESSLTERIHLQALFHSHALHLKIIIPLPAHLALQLGWLTSINFQMVVLSCCMVENVVGMIISVDDADEDHLTCFLGFHTI